MYVDVLSYHYGKKVGQVEQVLYVGPRKCDIDTCVIDKSACQEYQGLPVMNLR